MKGCLARHPFKEGILPTRERGKNNEGRFWYPKKRTRKRYYLFRVLFLGFSFWGLSFLCSIFLRYKIHKKNTTKLCFLPTKKSYVGVKIKEDKKKLKKQGKQASLQNKEKEQACKARKKRKLAKQRPKIVKKTKDLIW